MTHIIDQVEWLSCAETAKLLRTALARAFPGVKFSVRSDVYSGGASIRVRYAGGPPRDQAQRVADVFQGAGFDGTIDLKYSVDAYLDAAGNVVGRSSEGTAGSMGCRPAILDPQPAGSRKVHFGADFIFVDRD